MGRGTKITIIVLSLLIAIAVWSSKDMPPSPQDYTVDAKYKARSIIAVGLKAPSSAKFCGESIRQFEFAGAEAFEVKGCVDAQNSFGAMLRSYYTVVLLRNGNDWKVAGAKFD